VRLGHNTILQLSWHFINQDARGAACDSDRRCGKVML
jgi:hypothetical protein